MIFISYLRDILPGLSHLQASYPPFWSTNRGELFGIIARGKYNLPDQEWKSISDGAKKLIKNMVRREIKKKRREKLTFFECPCSFGKMHMDVFSKRSA